MRSRMTLATIDAAAIDCERWSPLISARQPQGRPGGTSRPSASAWRGLIARPISARRIASRLARNMLMRSMPSALTDAIETPSAVEMISANSSSRSRRRQPLGIVQAIGNFSRIEDHRGGDHRSGERPASGLVEAGDRPQALLHRLPFEGEVGPLDDLEEERRIGTRLSHVRQCSHRFRFSARPSRPLGRGGKAPSGCGEEPDGILSQRTQCGAAILVRAA